MMLLMVIMLICSFVLNRALGRLLPVLSFNLHDRSYRVSICMSQTSIGKPRLRDVMF